jgi:hypothetical protein
MDKVEVGQIFSQFFNFLIQFSFYYFTFIKYAITNDYIVSIYTDSATKQQT